MAMTARQQLPRIWLVTDERQGNRLLPAVEGLPSGAGILFRHYSLALQDRRQLFDSLAALARPRNIMLLVAGEAELAEQWGADGWHGWGGGGGLHSKSVHDLRELRRAESQGAALLFVSPVFATRSHPGAPFLGPRRFAALVARARRPIIALGGVTPSNAGKLVRLGAHGWAGVDAWTG
jgi:thiamine-phosphate pyrophosphorylase